MSQYYYWLIPDEPHLSKLEQTINNFAQVYQTPSFTPHITIATSHRLMTIPIGFQIPTLQFTRVHTEHLFFRALYFQCSPSSELQRLRYYFGGDEIYTPHLSLIYGHFSKARQNDWCAHTQLYDKKISFSTIWVIRGGKKVQDWTKIMTFSL